MNFSNCITRFRIFAVLALVGSGCAFAPASLAQATKPVVGSSLVATADPSVASA